MKIIKRLADNVVLYAGDDLVLSEDRAAGGDWQDLNTTTANAVLVDGVTLPASFHGAAFTHDDTNGFVVHDQALVDSVLAPLRAAAWEKIKAHRDRRQDLSGFMVGTKWFHSDSPSRIKYLALTLVGANVPADLQWKTMDGTFVTMTQTLAGQVFQAAMGFDMALFAKAEQHRLAMLQSDDPANYDFSSGWPNAFTE